MKFKDREGHCNVPNKYSDNPELSIWVKGQQANILHIPKDRAAKLNSIGLNAVTWQDVRWEIMFEELRKYKDREGHCNVPFEFSDNPELGRWVRSQRARRSKILKERASKLDSIGFTWGTTKNCRWDIMFEELRKYKYREGHCNVPYKFSDKSELGKWVSRQRAQRLKMSKERASKLDSIGFIWGGDTELDIRWEIMFEELRKFKEREGHCNVPYKFSDNPELGTWVYNQQAKKLKISKERAAKLDSIGFSWGAIPDVIWDKMFEELRKFKDREGHCNVPNKYSDNIELGKWVRSQRARRSKILKERASKLDSIGFTWCWGTMLDLRWEIMFEELRKYKDRDGHCNV